MQGTTSLLQQERHDRCSDVRVDLGVGNYSWEQCNRLVEVFLLANWVREFKDAVSVVLGNDEE